MPHAQQFFEDVLGRPSDRRVHHASDADCDDGNFGGLLIIFDRLLEAAEWQAVG